MDETDTVELALVRETLLSCMAVVAW